MAGVRGWGHGRVLHRPDRPLALPDRGIRLDAPRRRSRGRVFSLKDLVDLAHGKLPASVLEPLQDFLARDLAIVAKQIRIIQQRQELVRHLFPILASIICL